MRTLSFLAISFDLGIFSSSIKENILFGQAYDQKVFHHVVQATALDTVCQIDTHFTKGFNYLPGFWSTISRCKHSRWWPRCDVVGSKTKFAILKINMEFRRVKKHEWICHEHSIVMQISTYWMIHYLLWIPKYQNIFLKSKTRNIHWNDKTSFSSQINQRFFIRQNLHSGYSSNSISSRCN